MYRGCAQLLVPSPCCGCACLCLSTMQTYVYKVVPEVQSDTETCLALVSACGSNGLQCVFGCTSFTPLQESRPLASSSPINIIGLPPEPARRSATGGRGRAAHDARTGDRCTCDNRRPIHCWVHTVEHAVLVRRRGFGSLTPWYLASREAEQFSSCRTQVSTVWPVKKGPFWPGLKSSGFVFKSCS